jgi:hypothetical protein
MKSVGREVDKASDTRGLPILLYGLRRGTPLGNRSRPISFESLIKQIYSDPLLFRYRPGVRIISCIVGLRFMGKIWKIDEYVEGNIWAFLKKISQSAITLLW